ncbi:MAG: hypothetical protein AAB975_00485, partial [Patescibacteria group bacterium]
YMAYREMQFLAQYKTTVPPPPTLDYILMHIVMFGLAMAGLILGIFALREKQSFSAWMGIIIGFYVALIHVTAFF